MGKTVTTVSATRSWMHHVIDERHKLQWYARFTFIEELDEVQGMFQDHPHGFKDVAPQHTLRLGANFQSWNDKRAQHWKVVFL